MNYYRRLSKPTFAMICWWRLVHYFTLKMLWLLLLCFLWSTSLTPVVFAAPALPDHGHPALDAHLTTTVPTWYMAVLAVVCIVCPVLLLTMCLCCKKSAFKPSPLTESTLQIPEVNSISSHVSRDMQLQGLSSGNQSPLQEQIQFESLPDLSHVWKPSHFPSTAAVSFPQTFEEESPEDTAAAVHWFGSPHQNFPRSQLQYVRQMGIGRFGLVLEGRALGVFSDHTSTPESCASSPRTPPTPPSQVISVVVKTLREEADQQQQAAFLQEMAPYRVLDHRNVLRVLAVCLESPPLLVLLQYCNKGTLKRYLQQEGATLSQRQLLTIVTDVAAGLAHMHEHNFCHTDLAARNCLVDGDGTVKVGDYGCSLDRYKHEYYLAGDIALPLRWCPPESLTCTPTVIHTSRVNTWGNVWSYGVVCHEVFTLAAHLPYHPLNDEQVLQRVVVEQAITPDLPLSLHTQVRALIQQCWVPESSRISMTAVHSGLCQTLVQLYGVQHASYDPESLPSSLHLPASPRSAQEDLEAKWNKLEHEQRGTRDHSVSLVASPRDQLRFENDFVSRETDDLEARVAATFGSSAPSWLGLDPDQPMDSLTREISSAIQRLDDALAEPTDPDLKDPILEQNKNANDDDLFPAFVIGKDSLVTRAPRSLANMSASTSNLTSIGAEATATAAVDRPPSDNITRFAHLSSSAGFMTQMGLEEDGLSMRLEKGEFSELVKQKSMSVQNLMRLTVVDGINLDEDSGESDSSCKFSMGDNTNLLKTSTENSAKKQTAEEKQPLDFSGSTSSILSSALSTVSSGATRSSVRDPFLVAANSSELLLQEEFSEQEFTLNEGGSNPNLTVEDFVDSKAESCDNDSRLCSSHSSVHQQDKGSLSGEVETCGVMPAEDLIVIDSNNSSYFNDSIFSDNHENLMRKLESSYGNKSPPKSTPSSAIVSSQDGPVLSTPDVTLEACHSFGCASTGSFGFPSGGEDQLHRGSFDGGQDPLPDIVVHDHTPHAKRHRDEADKDLQSENSVSKLSLENLPSQSDKLESSNSCTKSPVEHDLKCAEGSDQIESPLRTSSGQSVDGHADDYLGLGESKQHSPKFDPVLNSTFSIFASKEALGESRDSETSGIVTGGCTAFTVDMTNCSGISASEMLSSDSVFLDGTFDVAEDEEENLHDCSTGNEISQDPELSEATVQSTETSAQDERPSLAERVSLNHESVSTVENPELVTNFIVDPLQEVQVALLDRDLLPAQPLAVNPLDWSVDSLPPNSILDPHAGRHHFKLLLSGATKDVLSEDKEMLVEDAALEQANNIQDERTDVGQVVQDSSFILENSKVQVKNLNSVKSKRDGNTEMDLEETAKDLAEASPFKGNLIEIEEPTTELPSAEEATSDLTKEVLGVDSNEVAVTRKNSSLPVKNEEIADFFCVSKSSPKGCSDGRPVEMEAGKDDQMNDVRVDFGLRSLKEELHGNPVVNNAGDCSTNVQNIVNSDSDLNSYFGRNHHTVVPALMDGGDGSNENLKMTFANQVGGSGTLPNEVGNSETFTNKVGDDETLTNKVGEIDALTSKVDEDETLTSKVGEIEILTSKVDGDKTFENKVDEEETFTNKVDEDETLTNKVGEIETLTNKVGVNETLTDKVGESETLTNKVGESETLTNKVGESETLTNKVGESETLTNKVAESETLTNKVAESETLTNKVAESETLTNKVAESETLTNKVAESETLTNKVAESETLTNKVAESETLTNKVAESETLTNKVAGSETLTNKVAESDVSLVPTPGMQFGKSCPSSTAAGQVGECDSIFNESDALTASTTSVNSDIAVIDTPETESNEGEFWQQQMSAWKTAAQETRMLLLEASTASPLARHQDGSKKNVSYMNDDLEFSPCKSKEADADSQSVTSSSAYSVNDRETDCSFESSPCRKKYPVTPAHFVSLPRSGESSSDSSPVCSTVRPLITPAGFEAKKGIGAFPSPIKRPSYLSSPTSSCGSESPSGAHSSYVSYADDAFQDPLAEGEDLLGYCSDDLNALRAELSLKLPTSPREKDAQSLANDSDDVSQYHDGERSPDYTYCGNMSDDVEVVDNNRDHVIINYRPPTTLSPIKEEPCSSVGWDSCNFEENSASTYNSSIELVDCYEDSPATSALDVVSVEDSDLHSAFSMSKLSRTTLQEKQESKNDRVQVEGASENADDVNCAPSECRVSQHPISSSSVILTADNEVIAVDRDSLILEDLETDEDRPSVLVFTPRDDPDKPKTLDSDDLLVVDVDTHEASIVETPKPRSLLAFVHSPPLSPQVFAGLDRDDGEELPVTENEALERLHQDYQDDVDQDSLPYEVNSSSDKLLYLKFRENLAEHNALNRKTRGAKDFRESGPRSIDCAFLSDPLCDMDFDMAWQQRSLDNFKLGDYYSTPSRIDSTEASRDDMLRSDVNGCLTTNSPNTASETSQSSGLMFRLGTEEKETEGENVSRYQPYFNTSLNSLSQLDSSLMYGEDHVSLPYTVNLRSPYDEQNDHICKPSTSFSNFKSLDSAVNSKNRMKDFVSSKAHSEDTFIRSEEIDLKDQMVRELGEQIECIKSYRKEKRAVSGDEDSSDEELTSFSLGLLTQAYNEGNNGLRHDSPDESIQLSDDGSQSRKSFTIEAPATADDSSRNSCANYDSDDYSAETDYTGSNERRVYDSLRCVAKSDDIIPRPMNPEPAELSDLPCTPSPSISIDCSVALRVNTDEEQKMHSSGNDVFTPVKSIVVNGCEIKDDSRKKSNFDSAEKSAASYRFHASSSLKLEEIESDNAVEDLSIGESKSNVPSPVVTPGMLSSIRYRIDSNLVVESPLTRNNTDVDGNDCIPSEMTCTNAGNENIDKYNGNYSSGIPAAVETRNDDDSQLVNNDPTFPDHDVGREELYPPDWQEEDEDDEENETKASPGPSKRRTDSEVDSEDEDDEEEPIESDDSDVSDNNSSSSGEFLWQAGDAPAQARPALPAVEEEEDMSDGDSESGEEEFTPSFWDATRTPTRSLLKSGCEALPHDRSVHWKRQRHHRVYEYPPEPPLPTFPPPPSHRPLWDPPITPFSPPHHQWGVEHPHGEPYPALQAYMQRGFLQQDGFLLDDGEFYNPELHYNFSQSSFTPAEYYANESPHGNPNTPNFDSPEPSNMVGAIPPSYMTASGGDTDSQLPPTHEQLQNMLLYQFAPASNSGKIAPKACQTIVDQTTSDLSTEDGSSGQNSSEKSSSVLQDIVSCLNDTSRPELHELSSASDVSSAGIDEAKNPNSIGELRHLKEQLKLDIPKLRNEDENCTGVLEGQGAMDENSSSLKTEVPVHVMCERENSGAADLIESNSFSLNKEVPASDGTELMSDVISSSSVGKLSCHVVKNGAMESKVGNILFQSTASAGAATSPVTAIK